LGRLSGHDLAAIGRQSPATVRDIHAKLMLFFQLGQHLPCGDLRDFQVHLWKKRCVFKNMISRQYGPNRSIPDKPIFSELNLAEDKIAEIGFRFGALRPYLKADRMQRLRLGYPNVGGGRARCLSRSERTTLLRVMPVVGLQALAVICSIAHAACSAMSGCGSAAAS
jgi:hypothetical protein